ncbi:MAG TPA: hypothetical protein VND20_04215 [Candidatus Binataceae bacterium]|nr:hypothetical protein [Candidatus Binataceae bacterium]
MNAPDDPAGAEGAPGGASAGASPATIARSPMLACLTAAALLVGLIAAASYAVGVTAVLRMVKPALGGWLAAHQFYLMEGGATAFGLLVGIRLGRRIAGAIAVTRRMLAIALAIALVALVPLVHLCAAMARLGWNGGGARLESWLVGREGYAAGEKYLDTAITAIYFFKTAAYAALGGVALIAIVIAASAARGSSDGTAGAPD